MLIFTDYSTKLNLVHEIPVAAESTPVLFTQFSCNIYNLLGEWRNDKNDSKLYNYEALTL